MPRKVTFVGIAAALLASMALAQQRPTTAIGGNGPRVAAPPPASKFSTGPRVAAGTTDTFVLTIGAWEMQPEDSSGVYSFTFIDNGAYLRSSSTGGVLTSSIHLPSGALIDHLELDACDEDATNDIEAQIIQCDDDFAGPGQCTTLDDFSSSGTPGCFFLAGTTISYTIPSNSANDFVVQALVPNSNNVGFRGLKVYYKLQVSPAPGSATFGDVPLADPGFQYIEALVASGITAGCGGGNYCPDNFLTRRQMAVFLAKALGLRWPF